jgi:hypothetical protein
MPANTNAPDANYPYGSARDIAVPGDGTGTPYNENVVNDQWGFNQKLLNAASIVPSGSPETILASQYYDAMRATAGFPGLIVPMALNVDPATAGIRVLVLDGSGVLRANYSELDTNTYVGDGNNATADGFFHADDAAGTSRNTAGAYLILPVTYGHFLRGIDPSGIFDPEVSRLPGESQGDAVEDHVHKLERSVSPFTKLVEVEYSGLSEAAGRIIPSVFQGGDAGADTFAQTILDANFAATVSTATETRPTNMAVNWGVWY